MSKDFYSIGMDISINKGAIVVLGPDGGLHSTHYLCDRAKDVKASLGGERIIKRRNTKSDREDKQAFQVRRLHWLEGWYREALFDIVNSTDAGETFVGMEDYAYDKSQGAHQIGEVAGMMRLLVYSHPWRFRLHSPTAIKYYAAEKGSADKDAMRLAVMGKWGVDFDSTGNAAEDLYDAYAIAQVIRAEVQVRRGELMLADLSEPQIKTFNRVTRTFPVNLLARPWITGG